MNASCRIDDATRVPIDDLGLCANVRRARTDGPRLTREARVAAALDAFSQPRYRGSHDLVAAAIRLGADEHLNRAAGELGARELDEVCRLLYGGSQASYAARGIRYAVNGLLDDRVQRLVLSAVDDFLARTEDVELRSAVKDLRVLIERRRFNLSDFPLQTGDAIAATRLAHRSVRADSIVGLRLTDLPSDTFRYVVNTVLEGGTDLAVAAALAVTGGSPIYAALGKEVLKSLLEAGLVATVRCSGAPHLEGSARGVVAVLDSVRHLDAKKIVKAAAENGAGATIKAAVALVRELVVAESKHGNHHALMWMIGVGSLPVLKARGLSDNVAAWMCRAADASDTPRPIKP